MQDKNFVCGHKWDLKKKLIHESVIFVKNIGPFLKKNMVAKIVCENIYI